MDRGARSVVGASAWGALALAFLAFPGCTDEWPRYNLDIGQSGPYANAVFCDIEDRHVFRHCAEPEEVAVGIDLSGAAIALVRLQSSNIGLDYSPEAIAAFGCTPGPNPQPVVVAFKGRFPDGYEVCLNCDEAIRSGGPQHDAYEVCVAKCRDLYEDYKNSPNPGIKDFCYAHARPSTNGDSCFDGACSGAAPNADFVDPRRTPEPVEWADRSGVEANTETGTLVKTVPSSPRPPAFDAGAASRQLITHGDGYVEVTATETTTSRILGLSTGAPPDGVYSDADITFGIRLDPGGIVKISEGGVLATPPDDNTAKRFAPFVTGDRLRVTVEDNHDGSAKIRYSLIPAAWSPDITNGLPLRTVDHAPYPFRVDATLANPGATLTDVRIVRIK